MTNAELLAKIKAEIERRINELGISDEATIIAGELYEILSFLSDLEKSLTAKVADGEELNWEIEKHFAGWEDDSEYGQALMRNGACTGVDECKDIARHFAEWQREQDEKEQADLFTIVALDAAQRAKEQMMENYPKWRRIKAGERLPCPAYVWTIAYDNYPDCFEGRLMPNIQGVKVGQDTWYLPVDVIHNLPKEDEK